MANMEIETVNQKKRKKVRVEFDYPQLYACFLEYHYTYDVSVFFESLFALQVTRQLFFVHFSLSLLFIRSHSKVPRNLLNLDDVEAVNKAHAILHLLSEYLPDVAYQ
jgi:hypothetical protein